jgi:sterol desaturase/sphingolipid hydroxylase (fatty acid hydroxylase superfamily)
MLPTLLNLAISFLAFGLLARLCACNPGQPSFLSRELADNALYWFLGVLFYADLSGMMIRGGASVIFRGHGPAAAAAVASGYGWLPHLPLLVQALLVLVAMDLIQYWMHRLFHGHTLWPFHAIHHSAEEIDWTTGYRFHPVNFVIYSAGALALVKCLGFSPAAYLIIAPFNLIMSSLVHANLNWTFGPFRYVLASPVFHRWHHVKDPAVRDKNFAPTFPVLDLMFGTFYMPRGVLPADYGVDGVPSHFVGQLAYPFVVYAERMGLTRKPRPGAAAA